MMHDSGLSMLPMILLAQVYERERGMILQAKTASA